MSKSKIPTVEEWLYPAGVPEKELDHYLEIVKYAELVRAATLEEVVTNTNHTKAFIKKDKQSILDLVTHPNLEIK